MLLSLYYVERGGIVCAWLIDPSVKPVLELAVELSLFQEVQARHSTGSTLSQRATSWNRQSLEFGGIS